MLARGGSAAALAPVLEPTEAALRVLAEKMGCPDETLNRKILQKDSRPNALAQGFSSPLSALASLEVFSRHNGLPADASSERALVPVSAVAEVGGSTASTAAAVTEPVAADEDEELRDPAARAKVRTTIFLGCTSNLVSAGTRETIRWLLQHRTHARGSAAHGAARPRAG